MPDYPSVRAMPPQVYRRKRAAWFVNHALRDGRLSKPARCEMADASCCGRIEGHHPDYARPLSVRWLCASHHKRLHSRMRKLEKAA